jgi:hypothetical protein
MFSYIRDLLFLLKSGVLKGIILGGVLSIGPPGAIPEAGAANKLF